MLGEKKKILPQYFPKMWYYRGRSKKIYDVTIVHVQKHGIIMVGVKNI